MPRGNKFSYPDKQKHTAEHIEEVYEKSVVWEMRIQAPARVLEPQSC